MIIHAFIHDDNLFIHQQFICRSPYLNLGSLYSYPLLLKQSKKHGIEYANLATSLPIQQQQQQQQQHQPPHLEDHHHHHQDDSNSIYYDHHLHMLLIDYFQLNIKLQPLYHQWSTSCPRMAIVSQHLPGMAVVGSRDGLDDDVDGLDDSRYGLDHSRDGLDDDLDHFYHHHYVLIIIIIIIFHFNQSSP